MATRPILRFLLRVVVFVFAASLVLPLGTPLQASGPASAVSPAAGPGAIAYVRRSTHDIHVISPDGSGDRVLWTAPRPLVLYPAMDLAWRPDGRELAFTSQHEDYCSWYESDVYAVKDDGTGYRRLTNAPACAELAALPKGSVTFYVAKWTTDFVQAYVAGAPMIKTVLGDGMMTFEDVADFGPGVWQPAVGISGLYRVFGSQPLADVQPGTTVTAGDLYISPYSGISGWGVGEISWKADGSALGYAMRDSSSMSQIPANPGYGKIGLMLPAVQWAAPNRVAWGPTAATQDQYLYFTADSPYNLDLAGIYLNTVGDTSGGTQLVPIDTFYGAERVYDVEWLPDGSGFLFCKFRVEFEYYSDIYEYDFATQQVTQLTDFGDASAHQFSISPDGQRIVVERVADEFDTASSLWIMNRDGSGLHKLLDDAGRPAWGQVPAAPSPRAYIPLLLR